MTHNRPRPILAVRAALPAGRHYRLGVTAAGVAGDRRGAPGRSPRHVRAPGNRHWTGSLAAAAPVAEGARPRIGPDWPRVRHRSRGLDANPGEIELAPSQLNSTRG